MASIEKFEDIQARQKAYETYIRFEVTPRRVEDLNALGMQIQRN